MRFLFSTIIFVTICLSSFAQHSKWDIETNKDFIHATELFDQQKYAAAQKIFTELAEKHTDTDVQRESFYYMAVCGIRLFNSDAQKLLADFIREYPESPRMFYAYFEMGNYLFREQKYADALEWYSKVDIRNFSNVDIAEYFYKYAYCLYKENKYDEAKPLFKEVKDAQSVYSENALFYYSYLEYVDKNYTIALPGFEHLADSSIFSRVVPPYICQIYYVYEEYDKLIQYARKVEGEVNPKQLGDVYRVLAGAYYKTLQYDQALPYYEKYFKKATHPSVSDYYELGYLYYRAKNYTKAANLFQYVTDKNERLAQNAYYHLGDCYIQTGQKEKARNAFRAAMDYDVFPEITEDATFIHAKLIYELSYAPFNEAIKAMKAFLEKYPDSRYYNQANELLVKIFLSSKNYKDALTSLEKISHLTTDLKIAYQQIAYYRGLELFNNNEYTDAITHFDKSLNYGIFDKTIRSFTVYWKGEAYYRLKKYDYARNLFKDFVLTPGAFNSPEYKRAHYNIGYTFFEEKNYSEAIVWFRKFLDTQSDSKSSYYADACIRTADSYYMVKDFNQAVLYYGKAYQSGAYDSEYALFQEAFCQGLLGNHQAKISLLKTFMEKFPASQYYDDVVFELAEAYVETDQNELAIHNYEIIMQNYTSSIYIKRALLQVALIVYNNGDLDKSLLMYKQVVEHYPGSDEAQTALNMIRNIYRRKTDVNAYFTYVQQLGGYATIPEAEQDSLSFEVAQELYLDGNCDKALPLLKAYIRKFGDGFFVVPAHFYSAECLYASKYDFEALSSYEFVLHKAPNQYVERSLNRLAHIALDAQQYKNAISYLQDLEEKAEQKENLRFARRELITCYNALNEHAQIVKTAQVYLQTEKLSDKDERWAHLHMAHAYDSLADTALAFNQYRILALEYSTVEGAEANYKVAEYLFAQKKYDESEAHIIDFLEKSTPHQYWLGKSYILWARIFIARDELFQARYTLQNVLEHYKNKEDGIIDEVSELLDFVTDKEMEQADEEEESVVIPMGDNPELFETE
ncbi:MAG: tetratricopeptide repeat protein [Bacteroidales bacterium]|jgi:tetratricopeptide (TPR) repeat protein|nr:tetratricopeptide repeat protein [Bacteroidales bacterium]